MLCPHLDLFGLPKLDYGCELNEVKSNIRFGYFLDTVKIANTHPMKNGLFPVFVACL